MHDHEQCGHLTEKIFSGSEMSHISKTSIIPLAINKMFLMAQRKVYILYRMGLYA